MTRQARRLGGSMISAVSNRGLMRFMLYDGATRAGLFVTFLRRLVEVTTRRAFLIVDNLRVHHARPQGQGLDRRAPARDRALQPPRLRARPSRQRP
ncbi:transposase [Marinimicrococcus flavescens]|uniref:transposase n=1 Tax=Marinimicrococcus flavescens TaxID=3031815 RepID=UPI00389905F7